MPDDTTSPVAAEGLARLFHDTYERLAPEHGYETRRDSAVPWEDVPAANKSLMIAVAGHVLAALAGDSTDDDLPARMAEAMRAARDQWVSPEGELAHPEVGEHFAAAAMGVRDEHLAATLARLAHALGELSSLRDHRARWETEYARAERLAAELAEAKGAQEARQAHTGHVMRLLDETRKLVEEVEAERDRWKEAHDDLDSLISEERKQHETTLAERDALAAAVRKALEIRQTHHRTAHPTRLIDPGCDFCLVLLTLSRELPSRPDDPEEIRRLIAESSTSQIREVADQRLAQATTEETNDG